ncbi:hypothetical protein [Actinomadura bangladeshensis]|uniref:DUF3558 domain-containing protein n=1 Tax=Actinomadura bangladeshensis TaxID=453573 RepID=A0A6L9QYX2_9ACTN|nr:hypothetical protein [Actinomadura bangladeshensis]NEA29124.1 hypothetical protein [Actinomadura bangladeshensis]
MPAPDTDPESTGLAHRLRTDRKWRRGAVAAALVLVLGVAAVVAVGAQRSGPGGISDGPLTAAPAAADPVPAARIVTKVPANCGVSKGTAARLAPGSDPDAEKGGLFREGGPGSCMWYSLDDGKATCDFCIGDFRNERVLNVDVALAGDRLQSPISDALRQMDETPGLMRSSVPPEIVEGLGEEATARYSAETETEGAVVKFRVGNAVATIRYRGWDAVGGERRTIPKKTALDGAFAAASETAKSMGTAARPVLSRVKHPVTPSVRHVPKPCDAVPAATVEKVARGAYRRRATSSLFPALNWPGTSTDACTWKARTSRYSDEGQSRTLTVAIIAEEDRLPGVGAFTAARRYLGLYENLRAGSSPGSDRFSGFKPLAGPGDRAFAVTRVARTSSSGDEGFVVFQKRNLLVEVSYQGADEETPLSGSRLVDSAYTVAVAVERSLRS